MHKKGLKEKNNSERRETKSSEEEEMEFNNINKVLRSNIKEILEE